MHFLFNCQCKNPALKERKEEGEGKSSYSKPRSSKKSRKCDSCLMQIVECVHK